MNTSPADREGLAAFLLRMRTRNMDDRHLMSAFEAVSRRAFLRPEFHDVVWSSRMIPLDCGETLEGVDMQAGVLRDLQIEPEHRVLEIGTGSGFTAAVMSKLAKRVYSMDIFRTLFIAATQRMKELKIDNVITMHGDGNKNVADGPFDRIVVWAAFDGIPRAFIEHLVSGGVMICAIGEADQPQQLVRLTKIGSRFEREDLGDVRMQMLHTKTPVIL